MPPALSAALQGDLRPLGPSANSTFFTSSAASLFSRNLAGKARTGPGWKTGTEEETLTLHFSFILLGTFVFLSLHRAQPFLEMP